MAKYKLLFAIYVDWDQRAFLAKMTSFVVRYYVIYHSFPINSQYLMTWGVESPETVHLKIGRCREVVVSGDLTVSR